MFVKVVEYDLLWKEEYNKEASYLGEILKEILVEIHHIGSTAVPGLAAKPIIDIMPVVTDISLVDPYNFQFESLGYECLSEFGILGRRYFRKGGENRTHQVHIFEQDNIKDIKRHLAFRDFLRIHLEFAQEYAELKKKLADQYPEDIEKYNNGKDNFVKKIEQEALKWQEKRDI